jgi:hypothetical protein
MTPNMGPTDRIVRLLLAAVLAYLFVNETVTGAWGYAALAGAAVLTLTSLIRFCPLYLPFGIQTCSKKE